MEFGKVQNIDNINWKSPTDDPLTLSFLPLLMPPTDKAKFYIGAPAWGHKEWLGKVYPAKTKAANFLYHYSRAFNCIELNTTHYRIPTEAQVTAWTEQTPDEFRFCPKVPQNISHSLSGMSDPQSLKEWWHSLTFFKEKLGPCFIQFPPSFTYAQKSSLFHFLNDWPNEFPLSLEFRHPTWFADGNILPALTKYLQTRRIGLVITDVAGRQDVFHTSVSAEFSLIRFVGNSLHISDYERAKDWALRLSRWQELGLKQIYFIVHQPDDLCTPDMSDFVVNEFNKTCNAHLLPMPWMC